MTPLHPADSKQLQEEVEWFLSHGFIREDVPLPVCNPLGKYPDQLEKAKKTQSGRNKFWAKWKKAQKGKK